MPSTRKKRKVSDLTVDDVNALLRTLAEFQEQLDEEDEDLPTGLISGLE
jgi:phage terminase Nu1 subunit (DNA packaging protein)